MIREAAQPQIEHLRAGSGPQAFILDTYRFAPHSKGDDVRDPEEIERYKRRDPIPIMGERLSKAEREAAEAAVQEEVEASPRDRTGDKDNASAWQGCRHD